MTSTTNLSNTTNTVSFVNTANSVFAGSITSNINLAVYGTTFSQALTAANSFGGSVTLAGGTLWFATNGTASGLAALVNSGGTLLVDNTVTDIANRLNASANLTLDNGGAFTLLGNATSTTSAQNFNNLTIGAVTSGQTTITVTPGGASGAASVTFGGNLSINTNSGSLVNFAGTSTTFGGANGITIGAGGQGGSGVANIFFTQINGNATSTPANVLTNNILGAWATVGSGSNTVAASYGSNGVIPLAASNYTAVNLSTTALSGSATANVLYNGTTTNAMEGISGKVTINSLTLSGEGATGNATAWNLGASSELILASGLYLVNQSNTPDGFWNSGTVTAGTTASPAQLVIDLATPTAGGVGGSSSLRGGIANNTAGGSVTLVKAGPGTLSTYKVPLGALKYTGGTIIDGGTLYLDDSVNGPYTQAANPSGAIIPVTGEYHD